MKPIEQQTGHLSEIRFDFRRNSLVTFRLIAALSVMYTHGIVHMQSPGIPVITAILGFFSGIPLFFSLSGFLLWESANREEGFFDYAKRRVFRIYPELWVGVAVELIVLLSLFKGPIQWGQLGLFALCQSSFFQFWTPDFLRGYGCGTPNGSLWSICTLIQFYVLLYPVRRIMHNRKLWVWLSVLIGSIIIGASGHVLERILPTIVYKLYQQTPIPYLWLFVFGMMLSEKQEFVIPFLRKWWLVFTLISLVTLFNKWDIACEYYYVFRSYGMILAVVSVAYRFPSLTIKRDISYGIYIYHMTVVNGMIMLDFTGKNLWVFLMMALSCVLAYISSMVFYVHRGKSSKK